MSDLKQELMDIKGVGEATAESILAVLNEHDNSDAPMLEKAITEAQAGNTHRAMTFLKRYAEE